MRCDHSAGLKVSWKLNDPPSYDTCCTLKNSVSLFSMHLFPDKRVTACDNTAALDHINDIIRGFKQVGCDND